MTAIDMIAAAMHADTETLRAIGQNVANAQSVAYRREIALQTADFTTTANGLIPQSGLNAPQASSAVDLTTGTLRSTGGGLDVALEGKGFFVVDTNHGEVLTRRGDFRLDADGRLVTQAGDPVLGASGPIQLGSSQPSIASDGTVRIGTRVVDRLRVVEVSDSTALQPVGNSAYALAPGAQSSDVAAPRMRQGFLETSNVQTVNEMVQLMETMRQFESAQRFVRGYDDMIDKSITTLGRI